MAPFIYCPDCGHGDPVQNWAGDPPPPNIPMRRTCPHCGTQFDTSLLITRRGPDKGDA